MNTNNFKKRGQGIIKISDLFQKYRETLRAPQKIVVEECIVVISELFTVTLKPYQCQYNAPSRTLTFSISGPLKSEIMLNKKAILTRLRERLGEKSAPREIL